MGLYQTQTEALTAHRLPPSAGALHMLLCQQALQRSGSAERQPVESWRHARPADEHLLRAAAPCRQALHQQVLSMVLSLAAVSQLAQQLVAGLHLRRSWWRAL